MIQQLPFPNAGSISQFRFLTSLVTRRADKIIELLIRKYGPIFYLNSPMMRAMIVSDPDVIFEVMRDMDGFKHSKSVSDLMMGLIGPMLVALDGEVWKTHRQVVIKASSKNVMRHSHQVCIRKGLELVTQWKERQDLETKGVNLIREVYKLMNDVIGLVLFSFDFGDVTRNDTKALDSYRVLWDHVRIKMSLPTYLWIFAPTSKAIQKSEQFFKDNVAEAILAKSKEILDPNRKPKYSNDVLDIMLDGNKLSPKEIEAEVLGLYLASIEMTTQILGVLLYVLSKHPEIIKRARNEIHEKLGKIDLESTTLEDMGKLVYMDAIMKEIFRYGSVPVLLRVVEREDCIIHGKPIPKGTCLFLTLDYNATSEKYFKDADAFNPERWQDSNFEPKPGTYIPFSEGPRSCAGERLALTELKALLLVFLMNFDWEEAPGANVSLKKGFMTELTEGNFLLKSRG